MERQFEDIYGYHHIITTEIARGGQGAVYRTQNSDIAVKVVFDLSGGESGDDPERNKRFDGLRLLPVPAGMNLTLPQATLKDTAGYVMTLLDDMDSFEKVFDHCYDTKERYLNEWLKNFTDSAPEFVDVVGQYIKSGGRRRRLKAYLRVAGILAVLHSRGLVYCDFSSRNAYISRIDGNEAVWLIDADNLDYQERTRHSGVYTPGYGAPEVVRGKGCTFYSDAYAFAVSLFWQLTGTHPFKGCLAEAAADDDFEDDAEEKVNAGEFPWIMDEEDRSNHIDARIQQEFVISRRMYRYFARTFSCEGKSKRQTRPTMFEWLDVLARDVDLSVRCSYCGMDYDESFDLCPWCDTRNKKVMLTSSCEKRQIWRVVHELNPDEVMTLPLRLIRGVRADECERKAFCLQYKDEGFILSDLNEVNEWSVSVDRGASFIDIYGRAEIPGTCVIKCTDCVSRRVVVIEVSII